MKSFLWYCVQVLFVAMSIAGVSLFFFERHIAQEETSVSPLPEFLTLSNNKQVTLLDLWAPFFQKGTEGPPDLTARSFLMYDLTTDKVVSERNAKQRMPMASLTKIMTAIISLEHPKEDNHYLVQEENLVGEDSMGVVAGETFNLEELLHGLMLPSGNDAAEVLATNFPGGRAAFLQAMNDKAKALGLHDTQFSNPSGLQGDGVQYTTAYDLLVITKYAMDNFPIFSEIVQKDQYTIPATATHQAYELINETNLLTTYPGVKGVKTGYTPEAGMCLITYIEYGGHQMIGVLLNSENRRIEMKELLDFSLQTLGIEPPEYTG